MANDTDPADLEAFVSAASIFINSGSLKINDAEEDAMFIHSGSTVSNNATGTVSISNFNTEGLGNQAGIFLSLGSDNVFTNDGTIDIDGTTGPSTSGIFLTDVGGPHTFINNGQLDIVNLTGSSNMGVRVSTHGILAQGSSMSFTNTGDIFLSNSLTGFQSVAGVVTNSGDIDVTDCFAAVLTTSNFTNQITGSIIVHDMSGGPITGMRLNMNADVVNDGLILIENLTSATTNVGITTSAATLTNNGIIDMLNILGEGISMTVSTSITNAVGGSILMEQVETGVSNRFNSTFDNIGILNLTNVANHGVRNEGAIFLNNGDLLVNAAAAIDVAIFNEGEFTNNETIDISNYGQNGIENSGPAAGVFFTNNGNIEIDAFAIGVLNSNQFTTMSSSSLQIIPGDKGIHNTADGTFNNNGAILVTSGPSEPGILNENIFDNTDDITIASIGNTGFVNEASFTNQATGILGVDDCISGVINRDSFVNDGAVSIDNQTNTGFICENAGSIVQNNGLIMTLNSAIGIFTDTDTFFNNANEVEIAAFSARGVINSGEFSNSIGSSVIIEDATVGDTFGFLNSDGLLTNAGNITIQNLPLGGNTIAMPNAASSSTIENEATGIITIDNIDGTCAYNEAIWNNDGTMIVANSDAGSGISNRLDGVFTNNGLIDIDDNTNSNGINNESPAQFNHNSGTIDIANVGQSGIINSGEFTTASTIFIDQVSSSVSLNNNTNGIFTASATSDIQISNGDWAIRNGGDTFTNEGLIEVENMQRYGLSTANGSLFTNDGIFNILNVGQLIIDNDAIRHLSGTITNSGSIDITNPLAFNNSIAFENRDVFTNTASGTLTISQLNGQGVLNFANGIFTNDGNVVIDNVASNPFRNTTAETYNNGTLTLSNVADPATDRFFNFNNAVLGGRGTINTTLVDNDATIRPGSSPGQLLINGDLDSSDPASILEFEVDGNAGIGVDPLGHDQIVVSGTTTLGGEIQTLTNGFTPTDFDCYTVIDSNVLSGTFATESQADYVFEVGYNVSGNNDVQLCGVAVLEIELLEFQVVYDVEEKQTELSWTSENEERHDYYLIQASLDGEIWQNIQKVSGQGSLFEYRLIHPNPVANELGKLYYRLAMVDLDAEITYSDLRVIDIPSTEEVFIWPNPLPRGEIPQSSGFDQSSVLVYNSSGSLVATSLEDMTILQPGLYIVAISDRESIRVVILPRK